MTLNAKDEDGFSYVSKKKNKKKNHQIPSPASFLINLSETWEGGGKNVKRYQKIFPNLTAETASSQIFSSRLSVLPATEGTGQWLRPRGVPPCPAPLFPPCPPSPVPIHSLSHLLSHLPSVSLFLAPPHHSSLFLPIFPGSFSHPATGIPDDRR